MDPTSPTQTRIERASHLIDLGRWADALSEVTAALAIEPGSFRGHCLRASCLIALDERGRALDAAATAVRLRPDDEWGHRIRSTALSQLGRHDEAVAAAREAVRVGVDDALPHVRLAKALLALPDRAAEAQTAVDRALALDPTRVGTHLTAAQVADALGDADRERAAYERVLQLAPENAEAINGLAALDNERVRFGSALRHQAGALSVDPAEPLYRQNLETIGRNLVALGVLVAVVAALPLAAIGGAEMVGNIGGGPWLRRTVGLAATATYGVVLWRTLRSQRRGVRHHLRRTITGLPATQPRFTFLLVAPAWLLLVGATVLPAPAATVASLLLVGLFAAARKGYPDRYDAEPHPPGR